MENGMFGELLASVKEMDESMKNPPEQYANEIVEALAKAIADKMINNCAAKLAATDTNGDSNETT